MKINGYEIRKIRGEKGWNYEIIHIATGTSVGVKLDEYTARMFAKSCPKKLKD